MNDRTGSLWLAVTAAVLSVSVHVSAQPRPGATAGEPPPPRTAWGDPDLQGVWDYRTITPIQRPEAFEGQAFFTEAQAAEFAEKNGGSAAPAFSWWEDPLQLTGDLRTSLIIDPPDGKIPPLTPAAEAMVARMSRILDRPPQHAEDRALFERCLVGRAAGPPMIPTLLHYDSRIQVFQAPGYVVVFNEMIHETRVIPVDGRPHLPRTIRQWMGDSRGHWEDDTLVVETTNLTDQTNYGGWGFANPYYRIPLAGANMHLVERFTRVDANTISYEFTVDDPTVFERDWSARMPMRRSDDPLYEYACHEGNRGLPGILAATRFEENAAAAGGDPDSK